ncbi:hypothetical protein GCM10023185_07220 [Hymenobacter saemangeumensis]|uniref:Secretion system C-terminal sorting domain-containing protein n=1 Tax=Hymenobacter saemangeumensis TaxID=1084522 RepID=A0ABP8I2E1_9BACT
MNKKLLLLSLLGLATSAQAQWVAVNQNNVQTPPNYRVDQLSTVSPTVTWGLTTENVANSFSNTFVKTNNPTGTDFDFNAITGTANYRAANIHGVSDMTALVAQYGASGGGEILRTTDGGNSWRKVTTTAQFSTPAGFNNWVVMLDATNGVSFGDPNGGNFEILTTANGGTTWTRVPNANIPQPNSPDEAGLVRSYFALPGTPGVNGGRPILWAGTGTFGSTPGPVRIMKSVDLGQTWTAANTPLTGTIQRIAFKDAMNGIAKNLEISGGTVTAINVIRTTDGGTTWTRVTPVGNYYRNDIDAANGYFYSVGPRLMTGNTINDFGSSRSVDGINWTNIDNGAIYVSLDLIANGAGYIGGVTNNTTGAGGLFKGVISGTRDAALQASMAAYPNPSHNGIFQLELGTRLKSDAQLTVTDALGRRVLSQTLNATAVGAHTLNLDLSKEQAGVYTLQVRTDAGTAQKKLVIE